MTDELKTALVIAACLLTTPVAAQQQIICVETDTDMQEQMTKHDEKLQFVGVNKLGQIFFVFAGKVRWTVWFVRPEGAICTGPMYLGEILQPGDPA